jgi:putative RNA 2'-phosphotransferase
MEQAVPPAVLYHGTGEKFVESILRTGLVPKSRLYVHLSKDVETARAVGKRHGKSVVFQVDALKMTEDGLPFFLSKNGIWLTAQVNASYLHQLA